jgi:hypothetical protein
MSRLFSREGNRLTGFSATSFMGRCHQLTQHLRGGLRPRVAQLTYGCTECASQGWRHRQTREAALQGLDSASLSPIRRQGIQ